MLLISLLGFWRVKRWERGVLSAQRDSSTSTQRNPGFISQLESSFSLRGVSRIELLRQGFGLSRQDDEVLRAEEGDPQHTPGENDPMITIDPSDPQWSRMTPQALETERQLRRNLYEAGFI